MTLQTENQQPHGGINCDMTEEIHIASKCQHSCEQTLAHCLKRGGDHADSQHIEALIDCAELCALAVGFMGRESVLHPLVCHTCAEACQICAESCSRLAGNDEMMGHCAEVCRQCAESCENMWERSEAI